MTQKKNKDISHINLSKILLLSGMTIFMILLSIVLIEEDIGTYVQLLVVVILLSMIWYLQLSKKE